MTKLERTELQRSVQCCRDMFIAFADKFEQAVLTSRQEQWAKAVISTVDMLKATETPPMNLHPTETKEANETV